MQTGTNDFHDLRSQPDRAPAFAPVVCLFAAQLSIDDHAQIEQARWALEVASHAVPNHDAVELRLIRVHRTAADQAFADEAIARFRSRLRLENRELSPEHRAELSSTR